MDRVDAASLLWHRAGMADELQERADRRFQDALDETGARDPREFYRGLLRELKERSEAEYEKAVARWREEVVEPLARGDGEPLERWLRFGVSLARDLHPGRTVVIDETGRAEPYEPPPSWDRLILHIPDTKKVRAVPVGLPPELTPPQRATVDLLVEGRNRLADAS